MEGESAEKHFLFRKENWAVIGEKGSSYFFNSFKARRKINSIHSIYQEDGVLVHEVENIRNVFFYYYYFHKDIYANELTNPADEEVVLVQQFCQLSSVQQNEMEIDFSKNDLRLSLFSMPNGKSPGSDGLPPEFYRAVWDLIHTDMLEVFNESLTFNCLSPSQSLPIVTGTPKKVI